MSKELEDHFYDRLSILGESEADTRHTAHYYATCTAGLLVPREDLVEKHIQEQLYYLVTDPRNE